MRYRSFFLMALFFSFSFNSYSQIVPMLRPVEYGDTEVARQYAQWARRIQNEGQQERTLAALERAADFASVSSDISYQLAAARYFLGKSRTSVIDALDNAIDVNRWEFYNKNHALLLKTEQLIAMRRYAQALAILDQQLLPNASPAHSAALRLAALRGIAYLGDAQALSQFRSLVLSSLERYPRDPRFLRIFLEYAHNRRQEPSSADINLLDLALRRLPFLLEADPELAWMAAPFIRDTEEARLLVTSYRAGAIQSAQDGSFIAHSSSIAVALNLGLIDDKTAADELFSGARGPNNPLPPGFSDGLMTLDRKNITDIYNLLRSEEGREYFTQKLFSFRGLIISDDDNDGYFESHAHFSAGLNHQFRYDKNQENNFNFTIGLLPDGIPAEAVVPVTGGQSIFVQWERYPSVREAFLGDEMFLFRPADFQYAPLTFITLGGSIRLRGLSYPVLSNQMELTRRSLVSFASSLRRPSAELPGAIEEIFFDRGGIPRQAVETLNGRQVSITEFERGLPVVQNIDLDLDGRMETIRRFRRSVPEPVYAEYLETFNYRRLLASSESDWTGDGQYKTGETYLEDGSVVYNWDMDGSGTMNYFETDSGY